MPFSLAGFDALMLCNAGIPIDTAIAIGHQVYGTLWLLQMTTQLGPLPDARFAQSMPSAQAFSRPHLPHQGTAAQELHNTDQQGRTANSGLQGRAVAESQQGRPGSQGQPTEQPAPVRSLHLRTGQLKMMHETTCPLQMELAKVDPAMSSLVMAMLRYDPQKRVSAAEALSHPFLSELSPVLHLLHVRAESKAKGPQGMSQGSAESADHIIARQALPVGRPSDQKASRGPSTKQPGLPFKPEPRRQPVVSLPTRINPPAHPAVPSWLLGTLPMPMPSDPLLRAAEPQLQSPQGTPQAGPVHASAQPQSIDGLLASDVAAPASKPASPEPAAAAIAVRPELMGTAVRGKGLNITALSSNKLDSAETAAQAPPTQQAQILPATLGYSPATAVPSQPMLEGSAAAAVGNAVTGEQVDGQAAAAAAGITCMLPATGQGQGQGSGPAVAKLESDRLPAAEEVSALGLGQVGTPRALAQGSLKTPGVVKAWNGVAQLLQQMTPISQVTE